MAQDEQRKIQAGLRSSDAFIWRRRQILLASARGERVPRIALHLGCNDQTVRNVIHGFNAKLLVVYEKGISGEHTAMILVGKIFQLACPPGYLLCKAPGSFWDGHARLTAK